MHVRNEIGLCGVLHSAHALDLFPEPLAGVVVTVGKRENAIHLKRWHRRFGHV